MIDGRRRRLALGLAVLVAMLSAAPHRAAAAPSDEETKSRQLFDQAEALANDGRWKEACLLFQASHDLHATGGTALRTADCYEKVNDYDHAIGMYQYILDHRATDKRADRVAIAEQRLAALTALRNAQKAQQAQQVQQAQVPPPPPPPPPKPNRVPAIVAFGVGGAGLVMGGVFGGLALAQANSVKDQARQTCPQSPMMCKDPMLQSGKDASTVKAWVANAGFVVAAAGVVTGVVLLVTASSPKVEREKVQQQVQSAFGPGGLTIRF